MTQVTCSKCGAANNTSDMGYCWKCKAPLAAPAGSVYYPLFEHLSHEHGLTLLESEMEDICQIVEKMRNPDSTTAKP